MNLNHPSPITYSVDNESYRFNLGKNWSYFSDYDQHIPVETTTLSTSTSTRTQEYVDEIYDEDYYMAPSVLEPYVPPPRECNEIKCCKVYSDIGI